jgi:outer membrane protein insertion porin family
VGVSLNSSRFQDVLSFNYTNPYFTEDGVSRGFSVFARQTDLSQINVASYTTDTIGASMNFGYPLSETQRLGFSFGITDTKITAGDFAVQEIIASPRINPEIPGFYESKRQQDGTYSEVEVLQPLTGLELDFLSPPPVPGFLDENGDEYLNWTVTGSWLQSTLNRGQLATRGASQNVSLELSMPGSDLEFYKLNYRGEVFVPIYGEFTLHLRTEIGFGDGYADTTTLPFYEHFFAGGFGSVRGYELNTLGPFATDPVLYRTDRPVTEIDENGFPTQVGGPTGRDFGYILDPATGKLVVQQVPSQRPLPFGGNLLVEGTAEMLFPMPFIEDRSGLRSALFFDIGNVFNTNCDESQVNCFGLDADELRYSVGIGVTWLSGFGPLTFSFAKPLNAGPLDRRESFQFTLGRGF